MAKTLRKGNGEEPVVSLTADPSLHPIAAAALLLMGDLTADQQVDVFRAVAKPGVTVLEADNALKSLVGQALYRVGEASGIVDGSSGLGALAAKNASGWILGARETLKSAARILGAKPEL